jgi:YHS domain-containing protein
MKREMKIAVLAASLLLVGLFVVSGCDKCCMGGHEKHKEMAVDTMQKVCPVSGRPINTEYWTEYKDQTVYFCSPGCKAEFEKNPEKYESKLPQFMK